MNNYLKYRLLPKAQRKRWSYDDFLSFRMQEMRLKDIESLLTSRELWDAEKELNDDRYRHIFNSKRTFASYFAKFMRRDILYLSDVDFDTYIDFINRHGRIVVKPDDMYAGIGLVVKDRADISPIEEAQSFAFYKEKGYIAEEYVYQAAEYSSIYQGSLNTLRVTTFVGKDGLARILFVVNQFGSGGSIVDNDDDTAIWCAVDKETGQVIACDIDEKTGRVALSHPDTHVRILGFINKDIDAICQLALEAAVIVPSCRLVGWDIAVRADGRLELIEGNVTPELELYQKITQKGLREIMDGK